MHWNTVKKISPLLLNVGGKYQNRRGHSARYDGWVSVDRRIVRRNGVRHVFPNVMPLPDHSVDGIMTEHFLEHLTDDDAWLVIQDCHRLLKAGATLRVAVPDINHPLMEDDRIRGADSSPYHLSIWSRNKLEGVMRQVGFEDVRPQSYWSFDGDLYDHHHRSDIDWSLGYIRRTVDHDERNTPDKPFGKLWASSLIVDGVK